MAVVFIRDSTEIYLLLYLFYFTSSTVDVFCKNAEQMNREREQYCYSLGGLCLEIELDSRRFHLDKQQNTTD